MIEDHPNSTITLDGTRTVTTSDFLSQVPLQFTVQSKPTYTIFKINFFKIPIRF